MKRGESRRTQRHVRVAASERLLRVTAARPGRERKIRRGGRSSRGRSRVAVVSRNAVLDMIQEMVVVRVRTRMRVVRQPARCPTSFVVGEVALVGNSRYKRH